MYVLWFNLQYSEPLCNVDNLGPTQADYRGVLIFHVGLYFIKLTEEPL